MYSTPRPTKTYGRKLSMKDRHGTSTVFSQHPNQSTDDEGPPRKRRTLLTSEDSIQDNDEVRYSQTSCKRHALDSDVIILNKVYPWVARKIVASVSRSISPESVRISLLFNSLVSILIYLKNSSKQKEKEREVTRHLNESTNVPPGKTVRSYTIDNINFKQNHLVHLSPHFPHRRKVKDRRTCGRYSTRSLRLLVKHRSDHFKGLLR